MIALLHLASTWAMVGFIWTIQLLHYPLMDRVTDDRFAEFESQHQRRVVAVIALFAPVEIVTAALVFLVDDGVDRVLSLSAGLLLAAIWISTAIWYAPLHTRLVGGFDALLHRRLVTTNWLRTAAWSVRGVLALVMVSA